MTLRRGRLRGRAVAVPNLSRSELIVTLARSDDGVLVAAARCGDGVTPMPTGESTDPAQPVADVEIDVEPLATAPVGVGSALFLIVIMCVTTANCPAGFAPIAIGLFLTVIHLVAIPVSNASVNPARSTATAIFGGAEALGSLWLFWLAPIAGGIIGGLIAKWLHDEAP